MVKLTGELILAIIASIITLAFVLILAFTKDPFKEQADAIRIACPSLNGTFQDNGISVGCYDYDRDGYRFYWRIDSMGDHIRLENE